MLPWKSVLTTTPSCIIKAHTRPRAQERHTPRPLSAPAAMPHVVTAVLIGLSAAATLAQPVNLTARGFSCKTWDYPGAPLLYSTLGTATPLAGPAFSQKGHRCPAVHGVTCQVSFAAFVHGTWVVVAQENPPQDGAFVAAAATPHSLAPPCRSRAFRERVAATHRLRRPPLLGGVPSSVQLNHTHTQARTPQRARTPATCPFVRRALIPLIRQAPP